MNNDAAFNRNGELTAIPAFGGNGRLHSQMERHLRSTASYGYVQLDNEFFARPACISHDALRELESGLADSETPEHWLEGLYGHKEQKDGADGDAFRLQVGIVYSLFD